MLSEIFDQAVSRFVYVLFHPKFGRLNILDTFQQKDLQHFESSAIDTVVNVFCQILALTDAVNKLVKIWGRRHFRHNDRSSVKFNFISINPSAIIPKCQFTELVAMKIIIFVHPKSIHFKYVDHHTC